jgi:arylsulfatase A-like enzyme
LVDLYPTLSDLAGLPQPGQLEGLSFRAVLDRPERAWKTAAFTDQPASGNWDRGGAVVGRSMKTDRYRYTAWIERATDKVVARQLYDHQVDPSETTNLAADSGHARLVERLHEQLTAGWRGVRAAVESSALGVGAAN